MLPHEVQALMAKILFFVFALTMFAMTKVRGEVPTLNTFSSKISIESQKR